MTIKEIAELCGVDQSTVWRWAKEPACKMQADIAERLDNAGHGVSADFTLDEALAIIGDGGGNKPLASLLAENARNKDALVTRREPLATPERLVIVKLQNQLETAIEEMRLLRGALENKRSEERQIEDPQEKQYTAIREFLIANLIITGRNRDFVYLPDLWRRFNEIMVSHRMDMNALLFAIDKIGLNGIRVVKKGGFKGLHDCRLITTDW